MNILIFVAILVVLIVIHEFGHFIVAKKNGIRVDEFGIFFGPKLWGKKIGETEYTINLFPLGGFVKIFGEDPDEPSINGPDKERSFVHKPKVVQAAVLVAGVGFNILFAWILFVSIFLVGMPTALSGDERGVVENQKLAIVQVLPESPAEAAGLLGGDEILAISAGGETVSALTPEAVIAFIENKSGSEINLTYQRGETITDIVVTPEEGVIESDPKRAAVGVSMGLVGTLKLPLHLAIWEGGKFTVELLGRITVGLVGFLLSALTLSADLSQVAGPVGIVGLVGDAASLGIVSLLMFTAFISLNLAVINLLPVPALDGGRLLFVIIEAVKGSPIKPTFANRVNTIGFILLILLMLVVTYGDIVRLIS